MKKCTKCGIEQGLDEYYKSSKNKIDGRQTACKTCTKKYDAERRSNPESKSRQVETNRNKRKQNRQQLHDYLKDKSCIICNENRIPCLQFDHRDPEIKNFNIADGIGQGYGWSTILKEIDQCDILCANCHAIKTASQNNWYRDIH